MKIQIQKREDAKNEWDVKRKIRSEDDTNHEKEEGESKIKVHAIIVTPPLFIN